MPTARALQTTKDHPSPAQLRALLELMLASELARNHLVRLHHAPETLTRSPAKLEILVNSLVVFIERGITDVTVQDILDASSVSRRTFYKYFRNKIDVLESLYKLAVDVMVLRYKAEIGQAGSVPELARRFVEVFFGYHRDLAPVIRMMQEEAMRLDSPLAPHRDEAISFVAGMLNDELARICSKRIDPLLIRALMWSMESVSIDFLRHGTPTVEDIAHGQKVMTEIVDASFGRAVAR
ncbi:MAG: TetR/AcrR family transcriptional regulator [Pseudomonadota bacterium]